MVSVTVTFFQAGHVLGLEKNRVVDGCFHFRGVFRLATGRIHVHSLNAALDNMDETRTPKSDGEELLAQLTEFTGAEALIKEHQPFVGRPPHYSPPSTFEARIWRA